MSSAFRTPITEMYSYNLRLFLPLNFYFKVWREILPTIRWMIAKAVRRPVQQNNQILQQ